MRYHASSSVTKLFTASRIGGFGRAYGSILNLPGVYNVDLSTYTLKAMNTLPSFKLKDVTEKLGVTKKLAMPDLGGRVEPSVLREYNMNDCVVVGDMWNKEHFGEVSQPWQYVHLPPYMTARGTYLARWQSKHILYSLSRTVYAYHGALQHDPYTGGGAYTTEEMGDLVYRHDVNSDKPAMLLPGAERWKTVDRLIIGKGFVADLCGQEMMFLDVLMAGER
jgi:hypothetical protein